VQVIDTFAIGNNRLTLGDSAALGIDRVVTSAIGSIVTSVPNRGEVYSIQVRQLLARGRDSQTLTPNPVFSLISSRLVFLCHVITLQNIQRQLKLK
jgi:hypothetical protein